MIAIDIDGVIADLEPFLVKSLEDFTKQKFNPLNPRTYDFCDGFSGLDSEDCLECIYDSIYYNNLIIPVINFERTYLALSIIQKYYGVVHFLTHRDVGLYNITYDWLRCKFGRLDFDLHFSDDHNSKEKWMNKNGINIIIEDRLKTVNNLENPHNRAFLVNQPWNLNRSIKGHVIRVCDLLEAVEHIVEKTY